MRPAFRPQSFIALFAQLLTERWLKLPREAHLPCRSFGAAALFLGEMRKLGGVRLRNLKVEGCVTP